MSMYSIDHASGYNDDAYKGYNIGSDGQVVEFYDHTNEPSIHGGNSGVSSSRHLLNSNPGGHSTPPARRRKRGRHNAGCCDGCVGCLITIGKLPLASAICMLLIWIGTGMFIGAGWAVLDETQDLFNKYGPKEGNPAIDAPPEYFLVSGGGFAQNYELRNPEDLGNRVPEVFLGLQRSFIGIIPFMFIFSIAVVVDGANSTKEIHTKGKGCKSSSAGICCGLVILAGSYLLLLFWVFFLCFVTLGVYYYRIVMLRCDDLNNRGFNEAVQKDICIDLVQSGFIMFRNTNDQYFGKICGPGDSSRNTVGDLSGYCDAYEHAWQLMLVCFAGCLLNVIAMMHSLMITTANYNKLQRKYSRQQRHETTARTVSPATTRRSAPSTIAPPAYVVGTKNGVNDQRYCQCLVVINFITISGSF